MRIEFFYNPDDFQELQRVLAQSEPSGQKVKRLVGWVVFIGLAVVLFIYLNRSKSLSAPPAPAPPAQHSTSGLVIFVVSMLVACSVLAGLLYLQFVLPRRQFGKMFLQANPEMQLAQTMEITDEGVSRITPSSHHSWRWDAFSRVLENQYVIVLQRGPIDYLVVPKRAVPPGELEALGVLLYAKIQSPTGAFPVTVTRPAGK